VEANEENLRADVHELNTANTCGYQFLLQYLIICIFYLKKVLLTKLPVESQGKRSGLDQLLNFLEGIKVGFFLESEGQEILHEI